MPHTATRIICPIIASDVAAMRRDMEAALAAGADCVECRLDFLHATPTAGELELLLAGLAGRTIVTFRPKREGGRFEGDESARLAVLHAAAKLAPLAIDIEMDVPPGKWPSGEIILSHHDFAAVPADLDEIMRRLDDSPAAVNKVAFAAANADDSLRAFDAIRSCRKPTIALAMGQAGLPSRILAGKFGAFGTFAALTADAASAPGQPTIEQLKALYRWGSITPDTQLFGVIGCPVGHSMSPAIHNAAFAARGIDAAYVPLLIQPGAQNFGRFMDAVAGRPWLNWRGLSVTIPHKENALAYVGPDNCDQLARRIGAINTITMEDGPIFLGDNTDYAAAIDALCQAMGIARDGLAGRCVAVLGAGGAARSIVAALAHYGAAVTVCNRTVARAEELAREFGCSPAGLEAAAVAGAEIIINCTSVGMHPHVGDCPLSDLPAETAVVFDTIYNPLDTALLKMARKQGCLTVSGLEMFVNQAVAQFERWTRQPAPRDVMRQVVLSRLA